MMPTPGLQNVTVLGNVIRNNEVIRVGLIQSAWCPYKRGNVNTERLRRGRGDPGEEQPRA